MRLQYLLHVVVGGLMCAPAVLRQDDARAQEPAQLRASLATALAQTEHSLGALEGVQADLAAGDVAAIERVRELTEPPRDTESRPYGEERLAALRNEVALLDQELAKLESLARDRALGAQDQAAEASMPPFGTQQPTAGAKSLTTGLSEDVRRALGSQPVRPATQYTAAQRRAHEPEGFVADSLRLGRALYRAGSYAEAVKTLAEREDAEAAFWRARSLEKLGHIDQALEAYALAITLRPGSEWAERAERDAAFLRWQRDFESRHTRP